MRCISTEIDHPPSFFYVFLKFFIIVFFLFLRTLDDQVLNTPDHFKMLSNIVNIKWQSLKTFHRGK